MFYTNPSMSTSISVLTHDIVYSSGTTFPHTTTQQSWIPTEAVKELEDATAFIKI